MSNMSKFSILFFSVGLGSIILASAANRDSSKTMAADPQKSSLSLVANGEDFVRQGFVSKDDWKINFDRLYVSMSDAVAYSTSSSFEPQKGDTKSSIDYQEKVALIDGEKIIDLAEGDIDAEPIIVSQAKVPTGFYNALSWKLSTAKSDSEIAGNTIALVGQATKDGETINFNLGFNQPVEYICGEFIGDERQGIVTADTSGQVETTFHFDHIFGDGDTPPEEALNQDALGFEPIAKLASNGMVDLDEAQLSQKLSQKDYEKLTQAIVGLGHVGEGHCVTNEDKTNP